MLANEILVSLALKNNGNWDETFKDIKNKIHLEQRTTSEHYITLLDKIYPNTLKHSYKPPFVLFYDGDIELLNHLEKSCHICTLNTLDTKHQKELEHYINSDTNEIIFISNNISKSSQFIIKYAHKLGKKIICVDSCGLNQSCLPGIEKADLTLTEYPADYTRTADNILFSKRILRALAKTTKIIECKNSITTNTLISDILNLKTIFK